MFYDALFEFRHAKLKQRYGKLSYEHSGKSYSGVTTQIANAITNLLKFIFLSIQQGIEPEATLKRSLPVSHQGR